MQIKIKSVRMINLQYSAPLVSLTYDRAITRCHDGQVHLRSIASNMEDVRAPQLPPEFKVEQKWLKFQCRECDVNMLNRCNVESGRVNKSNHSWNLKIEVLCQGHILLLQKRRKKKQQHCKKIPAPSHIITQNKEHSFCVFFPKVFHPWREWILVSTKWQTSGMCLERADSLFQI